MKISPINPVNTPSSGGSTSDSTPIVAGVVSAVAGAALIALAVFLKRRRNSSQKTIHIPAVPTPNGDDDSLEQGREQPPDARPPAAAAAVVAVGDRGISPFHHDHKSAHQQMPVGADGVEGGRIVPSSAPAALDGKVQSSAQRAKNAAAAAAAAADDRGAVLAGNDAADCSAEKSLMATTGTSVATTSTANVSTAEREELAHFHQRQRGADAVPISGGSKPEEAPGGGIGTSSSSSSSSTDRQSSAGDIGLGHAVLAVAQELARSCQIPGVSEAAGAVCIMANLVADGRENARASETRLRQCTTVVMALKRAAKVAEKVSCQHLAFLESSCVSCVGRV